MKKIIVFSALIILSITLWLANLEYPSPYLEKGFYTLLTLTLIYSLFKVIPEGAVNRGITDSKGGYHLKKKAVSIIHILVIVIAVVTIRERNITCSRGRWNLQYSLIDDRQQDNI